MDFVDEMKKVRVWYSRARSARVWCMRAGSNALHHASYVIRRGLIEGLHDAVRTYARTVF